MDSAPTRDELEAKATELGLEPTDRRVAKALALEARQAKAAAATPPPPEPRLEPDFVTVTTEVCHGDRVLSVTQHRIPLQVTQEGTTAP